MKSILKDGGELPGATNSDDIACHERYSEVFENDFRTCSSKECKNYCISQKKFCMHCSEVIALREEIVKLREVNNQMKVRILDLEKEQANLQRIDEPDERTKKNDEGELKLLVKDLFSSIEKSISSIKSIEEKVT